MAQEEIELGNTHIYYDLKKGIFQVKIDKIPTDNPGSTAAIGIYLACKLIEGWAQKMFRNKQPLPEMLAQIKKDFKITDENISVERKETKIDDPLLH